MNCWLCGPSFELSIIFLLANNLKKKKKKEFDTLFTSLWTESLNSEGQQSDLVINFYFKPLNTKKTTTYGSGNPVPSLEYAPGLNRLKWDTKPSPLHSFIVHFCKHFCLEIVGDIIVN